MESQHAVVAARRDAGRVSEVIDEGKRVAPARRRWRWVALVVTIAMTAAAGVAVLMGSQQREAKDIRTVEPTPALTVTTARPRHAVWPVVLEASGSIAAWQEASIGAQVGGYQLVDVRVNVGDQVTKGQVLARFDPALLQADAAQLEASVEQARANEKRMLASAEDGHGQRPGRPAVRDPGQDRRCAAGHRTACNCATPMSWRPMTA